MMKKKVVRFVFVVVVDYLLMNLFSWKENEARTKIYKRLWKRWLN